MALISFFIVLFAATLALTTVKGSRLRKRIAPHLATSTDVRKRKQDQKERFAAAAGLFKATEGALAHWKFWTRLERLLERSDMPLRTVELVYLIRRCRTACRNLCDPHRAIRDGDSRSCLQASRPSPTVSRLDQGGLDD